jgi:hypothetical protein
MSRFWKYIIVVTILLAIGYFLLRWVLPERERRPNSADLMETRMFSIEQTYSFELTQTPAQLFQAGN